MSLGLSSISIWVVKGATGFLSVPFTTTPRVPATKNTFGCGQNQWYNFGVDAPPILFYSSGDWDVHWG